MSGTNCETDGTTKVISGLINGIFHETRGSSALSQVNLNGPNLCRKFLLEFPPWVKISILKLRQAAVRAKSVPQKSAKNREKAEREQRKSTRYSSVANIVNGTRALVSLP